MYCSQGLLNLDKIATDLRKSSVQFQIYTSSLSSTHHISPSSGPRLVNVTNASEISTLMMDPVVRAVSANSSNAMPRAASDASKVTSQGPGLSKAYVGQKASFSVDCSKAGEQQSRDVPMMLCQIAFVVKAC